MKFNVGAEEEYFIVDSESKEVIQTVPQDVLDACWQTFGDHLGQELFQAQIELSSKKCSSIAELEENLMSNRRQLQQVLQDFGLTFASVSTYPTAMSKNVQPTEKYEYKRFFYNFIVVYRKLLVNGMHFHIECPSVRKRVQLFRKMNCFLPIFSALSASSPFFEGDDTGLQTYRILALESLPISGLPFPQSNFKAYQRMLKIFTKVDFIESPRNLYWHLRLGNGFPTMEMRIADAAPLLKTTIALASLYGALVHSLLLKKADHLCFFSREPEYVTYNLWQARRFDLHHAYLIDFHREDRIPFRKALEQLIEFVTPVAKKLNCLTHIEYLLTLFETGTSADRQRQVFRETGSLAAVNELILKETHDF